jgi:molecular chaperone IbpA
MTRITTFDLPQLARSSVGFDRMFDEINRQFENSKSNGYPPYNVVELEEDQWIISLAVAGFGIDDFDITLDRNVLTVEGTSKKNDEDVKYLHKGIGSRNFRRQFTLAEHIEVENANLDLGILNIHLKRNVPEEMQPKKISIIAPVSLENNRD